MKDPEKSAFIERAELELSKPLDPNAIREREGPQKRMLSYVSGPDVYRRMNRAFGRLGWSRSILERGIVHQETRTYKNDNPRKKGPAEVTKHYIYAECQAEVRICFRGEVIACHQDIGHGSAEGYRNKGEAIEKAMKTAATDAFKRCVHALGPALGLALYWKPHERPDGMVGDVEAWERQKIMAVLKPCEHYAAQTGEVFGPGTLLEHGLPFVDQALEKRIKGFKVGMAIAEAKTFQGWLYAERIKGKKKKALAESYGEDSRELAMLLTVAAARKARKKLEADDDARARAVLLEQVDLYGMFEDYPPKVDRLARAHKAAGLRKSETVGDYSTERLGKLVAAYIEELEGAKVGETAGVPKGSASAALEAAAAIDHPAPGCQTPPEENG